MKTSKSKHVHKRKKGRRRGDSDDEDASSSTHSGLQGDSPHEVQLRFGDFVAVCTVQGAPEALYMLAACVRIREWQKARVP